MIYYALTTYHVLCCVLHKMTVHPQENAVLLLSDIHKNSVAFAKHYQSTGIFDKVVLLEELSVLEHQRYLERKKMPAGFILSACCRQMEKCLKKAGVHVKGEKNLYVCPDHFPFGWYVIKNKLSYHCFEEGSGVLSNRDFALENMKRNKTQYHFYFSLGCFGENRYACEILADAEKQKPGYTHPKMADFSVDRILQEMPEAKRQQVLHFFGVKEKIVLSENSALLLTQHMANLGLMTLSEQHMLYTLFADYLFAPNSQLVIKPHPDDIAGMYRRVFQGKAKILPFAMPSELIRYCISGRFQKAAAAYSTSVRSMQFIAGQTLCFDDRILKDWRYMPQYDCAVRFLQSIGIQSVDTDGDELLLQELSHMRKSPAVFSHPDHIFASSAEAVVFSDLNQQDPIRRAEQTASFLRRTAARVVIFCQEKESYAFFDGQDKSLFRYIRPITLYGNGQMRHITIFTKEQTIMKAAEQFAIKKELPYTGVTVEMRGIGASEAEKIRVLEGVLAATEKRLNSYIEESRRSCEETDHL